MLLQAMVIYYGFTVVFGVPGPPRGTMVSPLYKTEAECRTNRDEIVAAYSMANVPQGFSVTICMPHTVL